MIIFFFDLYNHNISQLYTAYLALILGTSVPPMFLSRQTGKSVGILHDVVPSIRMSRQGQWDHSNSGS